MEIFVKMRKRTLLTSGLWNIQRNGFTRNPHFRQVPLVMCRDSLFLHSTAIGGEGSDEETYSDMSHLVLLSSFIVHVTLHCGKREVTG